jgi:hypothetical protein
MLAATYEIEIAGERQRASASVEALFAPENAHMRA